MSFAATLPRLRSRRRRPPSRRRVWLLAILAMCLGFIAKDAFLAATGDASWAVGVALWGYSYLSGRRWLREVRRREDSDAPMIDPARWEWLFLAAGWAVLVWWVV